MLSYRVLRFAVVEPFPYLMFYFEHVDCLDVVRVLHKRQDIPALLVE
jgi:plasmid stabilization system protein ParE